MAGRKTPESVQNLTNTCGQFNFVIYGTIHIRETYTFYMKDSRIGECLWSIWEGDGYESGFADSVTYYTYDHVDIDQEVVRKALASSIQRDGLAYSLYEAFQLIESGLVLLGRAGKEPEALYETSCDQFGESSSGAALEDVVEVTFVEVQYIDR